MCAARRLVLHAAPQRFQDGLLLLANSLDRSTKVLVVTDAGLASLYAGLGEVESGTIPWVTTDPLIERTLYRLLVAVNAPFPFSCLEPAELADPMSVPWDRPGAGGEMLAEVNRLRSSEEDGDEDPYRLYRHLPMTVARSLALSDPGSFAITKVMDWLCSSSNMVAAAGQVDPGDGPCFAPVPMRRIPYAPQVDWQAEPWWRTSSSSPTSQRFRSGLVHGETSSTFPVHHPPLLNPRSAP